MNLGVCGLGNTGSFAVIDLLREFDEVCYNSSMHEFSIIYTPDGILDLYYHIVESPSRFQSSDIAIYRFEKLVRNIFSKSKDKKQNEYNKKMLELSLKYIEDITQIKWKGTWGRRYDFYSPLKKFWYKVFYKLRFISDKPFKKIAYEDMRYSYRKDDFLLITKQYINNLIKIVNETNSNIFIIDQVFPGDNPYKCFKFLDNPYAIIVDRDPRDLYILSKCEINSDSAWIPTDNVEDFIQYYKTMREKCDVDTDKERILHIQYEDLIYNYENVLTTLKEFLNISQHSFKESHFKKEISINNTQLFNKHVEYADDIEKIEKELKDYLFDYSKYPKKIEFGKTF